MLPEQPLRAARLLRRDAHDDRLRPRGHGVVAGPGAPRAYPDPDPNLNPNPNPKPNPNPNPNPSPNPNLNPTPNPKPNPNFNPNPTPNPNPNPNPTPNQVSFSEGTGMLLRDLPADDGSARPAMVGELGSVRKHRTTGRVECLARWFVKASDRTRTLTLTLTLTLTRIRTRIRTLTLT